MIKSYLKIAFRNLVKNKSFLGINVIGLALGITCGLGICMIVSYEFSFDTFHPNHDKIFRVVSDFHYTEGDQYSSGVPFPLPASLKADLPEIRHIATIFGGINNQLDILNPGSRASEKKFIVKSGVFYTNPDYFQMFNFKWISGDPKTILSNPNTLVLTRQMAEDYFGTWQNAMGKMIRKDNNETLIVSGILENPPLNTDFQIKAVISYVTILESAYAKPLLTNWGTSSSSAQCYISLPDRQDEHYIARQLLSLRKKYFSDNDKIDYFSLQPLDDVHFSLNYGNFNYTISRTTLYSLSVIGILLLTLACINFINLATAQAIKRSKEVGIRKVLGSSRWQLGIQFLGETFIITVISTLLALVSLITMQPFIQNILDHPVSLNPFSSLNSFYFTLLVIISVTLSAGLYPAIIMSGYQPVLAIKNKLNSVSFGGVSLRRILIVFQFIIAQGLIICTLVVIRQIQFYNNSSLGFNKNEIITVPIPKDSISRNRYNSFTQELLNMPGVEKVSLSYSAPASQNAHTSNFNYNQNTKSEDFELNVRPADAQYFETYQLKLAYGRFYRPADTASEMVVNETFVQKLGIHKQDVLNKFIILNDKKITIVGVLKDFHQTSLRNAIVPIAILPEKNTYKIAGIKLKPGDIPNTIKRITQLYNKEFPNDAFEFSFLNETIDKFYKQEQHLVQLFKLFAAIGIFISCIGLYGLILFMTVQRIKEVGLRKVLGATELSIVFLFFREFIGLISIAFILAASVTWCLMNAWLNNFAYHTSISFWMILVVGLCSLAMTLLTVSIRTIRAAMSNPVESIRME